MGGRMFIKEIEIRNFRGIDLLINDLASDFILIGKNDSGKSNLCAAIRKVLDYEVRKNPLTESDSSNLNKENIKIRLVFDLIEITASNRTRLGNLIDKENDCEFLTVTYNGVYSDITQFYDEEIIFGSIDKSKIYPTNKSNPLDSILDLIYVHPNYSFERDKSRFFKNRELRDIEDKEGISDAIKNSIDSLNKLISSDDVIVKIKNEINDQEGFDSIFDDVKFEITSNISTSKLYRSLDIFPIMEDGKAMNNIGDGKTKTLSMLLQKLTYENDHQKILIVEEPENHLYPLLQKYYATLINRFGMNQRIYTTHSPFIINLQKMKQIVRLSQKKDSDNNRVTAYDTLNVNTDDYKKFGFLQNHEIAEMFFYDKVLLIEGLSEKYFYDVLSIIDSSFQKYLTDNKMGVFCVMGIDFAPAKALLGKIGVSVIIKTDNDIFKVPRIEKKRYAGFDRTVGCLDKKSLEDLCKLLDIKKITKETFRFDSSLENNELIEQKMNDLQSIFIRNGVYISSRHDGFEGDFQEFIGKDKLTDEDVRYLQEAKLKNLHSFVQDNNIEIKITEENKSSILVRFMNDE